MRTTHVYTSTHTRRWKLIHRGRYDTFERPHEAWEPQCVYITSPHDDLTMYHTSCTRETAKHVLVTTMICAIMATTFACATMLIHKGAHNAGYIFWAHQISRSAHTDRVHAIHVVHRRDTCNTHVNARRDIDVMLWYNARYTRICHVRCTLVRLYTRNPTTMFTTTPNYIQRYTLRAGCQVATRNGWFKDHGRV